MDYETRGGGGGREIEGEEGWDGDAGAPCLALSGGTCSWRGAAALAIAIAAASTDKELTDRLCAAERDNRD